MMTMRTKTSCLPAVKDGAAALRLHGFCGGRKVLKPL